MRGIRRYAAAYGVLFLVGAETFLVSPLLPSISTDLGVGVVSAASIVTSYVVVYAALAPLLAVVSERHERHLGIMVGTAVFAAANAICATAGQLPQLMAGRGLAGLGAAVAGPAIWAYIAETAPESGRGRLIGLGMAAFSCGQVVGVPVGGALAGVLGWRASFAAIGITAAFPMAWFVRSTRRARVSGVCVRRPRIGASQLFTVWGNGVVRRTLLMTVTFQAANLGCYAFLGSMLHARFALGEWALGLVGVTVGVGSLAGSLLAGRLRDRSHGRGRRDGPRIAGWCLVLGIGVVTAANVTTLWAAMVGVVVWFTASGGFVTESQTLVSGAVAAMRASASSWNTTSMNLGTAMGVWLVGSGGDVSRGTTVIAVVLPVIAGSLALEFARHERWLGRPHRTKPVAAT